MLEKIVSGGQTGADRAALDAGIVLSFPVGGFCPQGREAEDGPIDARYPLTEIDGGYPERTLRNVQSTDGTAVFYESTLLGGTEQTRRFCIEWKKPYQRLDIDGLDPVESATSLREFIKRQDIRILNVAGPRASGSQRMYSFVHSAISQLLTGVDV